MGKTIQMERVKNPLINILVRTHHRPIGFMRLMMSINSQTYKNFKVYVSVDDMNDVEYVLAAGVEKENIVFITEKDKELIGDFGEQLAIYNQYFNPLINAVNDGFIYCMDDDDFFFDGESLEKIANNLYEDALSIFRMKIFGTELPSHSFGLEPTLADIGTPCFCVHCKYAKQIRWDGFYQGDGRYIQNLYKTVPNTKWINEVVYFVPTQGIGKGEY